MKCAQVFIRVRQFLFICGMIFVFLVVFRKMLNPREYSWYFTLPALSSCSVFSSSQIVFWIVDNFKFLLN